MYLYCIVVIVYKIMSHFFEILIFIHNIWGNVNYAREINLIS